MLPSLANMKFHNVVGTEMTTLLRREKKRRMERLEQEQDEFCRERLEVEAEKYGSFDKRFHRERVVKRLVYDACAGNSPSAVYVGSPDLSDSNYFQSKVNDGTLPTNVMFYAVNKDSFKGDTSRYPNIEFHPYTTLDKFLQTQSPNSHAVVWMDLMKRDIAYTELAAACNCSRETVMLTLSLRGTQIKYQSEVIRTISDAMRCLVKHAEEYTGAGDMKNMALYDIDCKKYRHRDYSDPIDAARFNRIGMLAHTTGGRPGEFTITCNRKVLTMYMCVDVDQMSGLFRLRPYDKYGLLKDATFDRRDVSGNDLNLTFEESLEKWFQGKCW
jgi:hypothetical protein